MRTLFLTLLAACAGPSLEDSAPVNAQDLLGPEVPPDATLPPPTVIDLTAPPFVANGDAFQLEVDGALAGETVMFLVGPDAGAPGSGPCHRLIGGYCIDLARPVSHVGNDVAGPGGAVALNQVAPPWADVTYCYQAVIARGPGGIASALSDVECISFCADVDADGDGVCDTFDACPGGDDFADADGDGTCDALDECPGFAESDGDGDGVCDALDICPGGDDALDSDGDDVPNGCDVCAGGDDNVDTDGDGTPDFCDPTCTLGDWLVGTACNGVDYGGGCTPSETGYHYRGVYLNGAQWYACWWHTKNQAWNTSSSTNFYRLALNFGLPTGTGGANWCYPRSNNPCSSGACTTSGPYFDSGNSGAWGWCGGSPFTSGGFVCIPISAGLAAECD